MSVTHSYLPPADHSHPSIARAAVKAAVIAAAGAALVALSIQSSLGPSAATTPSSAASSMPLTHRVVTPDNFVPLTPAAPIASHSLGLVAGVKEQLLGLAPMNAHGVSIAERFSSAAGAQGELAHQYKHAIANGGVTRYRVVGIPGARGWIARSHGTTGINVSFTSGAYYYLVGANFPTGGHANPAPGSINAAATQLYLLVNGCVATRASA